MEGKMSTDNCIGKKNQKNNCVADYGGDYLQPDGLCQRINGKQQYKF